MLKKKYHPQENALRSLPLTGFMWASMLLNLSSRASGRSPTAALWWGADEPVGYWRVCGPYWLTTRVTLTEAGLSHIKQYQR